MLLNECDDVEELYDDPMYFVAFFFIFIPDIVGRMKCRRFWNSAYQGSYTDLVDVSDEAFGLLILENNRKKWSTQWKKKAGQDVKVEDSLYTKHARKDAREGVIDIPARREGWSNEGLDRYNKLCTHVQEMRKNKKMIDELDAALRNEIIKITEAEEEKRRKSGKPKKRKCEDILVEEVIPYSGGVVFTGI